MFQTNILEIKIHISMSNNFILEYRAVYEIYLFIHPSTHPNTNPSIYPPTYVRTYVPTYQSINQSINQSIYLSIRTRPDRPWGPTSLLYNVYRVFPGGRMRPGRDADPSPLLVPRSKNRVSYTSTLPKGLRGL
jgi:hypothetical protein